MPRAQTVLKMMREICLSLPDSRVTITWGEPHFRVGDKIFAGCGEEGGRLVLGFKLEMEHADAVIHDPRFRRAPYVGHKGWVSMEASGVRSARELRALILESYGLIAPKSSLAKLQQRSVPARSKPTARRKPASGRRARSPRAVRRRR